MGVRVATDQPPPRILNAYATKIHQHKSVKKAYRDYKRMQASSCTRQEDKRSRTSLQQHEPFTEPPKVDIFNCRQPFRVPSLRYVVRKSWTRHTLLSTGGRPRRERLRSKIRSCYCLCNPPNDCWQTMHNLRS